MEWINTFFSHLNQFDELIRWGGYTVLTAIVFSETGLLAGFFLPGDSLLVTAGLLSTNNGPLHIGVLIPLLCVAAILGDSTGYAVGRYVGPRIFSREQSRWFHKDHLKKTQQFYERYGAKTIVIARFVPIVRTFAPTVAGVGRMAYPTFLTFNVVGGVGWVCSMTLIGYFLGHSVPNIDRYLHWVILAIIGLSILPIVYEWWHMRRARATTACKSD